MSSGWSLRSEAAGWCGRAKRHVHQVAFCAVGVWGRSPCSLRCHSWFCHRLKNQQIILSSLLSVRERKENWGWMWCKRPWQRCEVRQACSCCLERGSLIQRWLDLGSLLSFVEVVAVWSRWGPLESNSDLQGFSFKSSVLRASESPHPLLLSDVHFPNPTPPLPRAGCQKFLLENGYKGEGMCQAWLVCCQFHGPGCLFTSPTLHALPHPDPFKAVRNFCLRNGTRERECAELDMRAVNSRCQAVRGLSAAAVQPHRGRRWALAERHRVLPHLRGLWQGETGKMDTLWSVWFCAVNLVL